MSCKSTTELQADIRPISAAELDVVSGAAPFDGINNLVVVTQMQASLALEEAALKAPKTAPKSAPAVRQ